jgi:predicted glycogen debranching enzyme
MLNHLSERIRVSDGTVFDLTNEVNAPEYCQVREECPISEFRLEMGLPVWYYRVGDMEIEKRLILPHHQNTVHITYRVIKASGPLRLELRPAVHFRSHEAPVGESLKLPYALTILDNRYELSHRPDRPKLRLFLYGQDANFTVDGKKIEEILYRIEESRGYEARGNLWSPGYFHIPLYQGGSTTLVASTESWDVIFALTPEEALLAESERRRLLIQAAAPRARSGMGGELVLTADQFIITPGGRMQDEVRARASGDEVRTMIAGYHWFTDWGRDTMISLEGLTLVTGRHTEAGWILKSFLRYVRDGLIPNLFPEGEQEALYHTADASLWFFHAFDRYLAYTNDRDTLRLALPKLIDIIDHHVRGTLFGIKVDPRDGLLTQGQEGYQLTWMDAKVDDWVVTPRRGKAVEINALWYNALKLLEGWVTEEKEVSKAPFLSELAEKCRKSFNERFWFPEGGYLYDVLDGGKGDDPSCRPNQVLALALRHPVLEQQFWKPVMDVVKERLLTPVGLRSLAPSDPHYKSKYYGDIRSRDAAYHQGTVWVWLIGPFIDGWLKLYPDDTATARGFIEGISTHLADKCVGSISEIFDGDPPFHPHGCISQAWSVAEVLRSWVKTADEDLNGGPQGGI